jgi:hypothetical protein
LQKQAAKNLVFKKGIGGRKVLFDPQKMLTCQTIDQKFDKLFV